MHKPEKSIQYKNQATVESKCVPGYNFHYSHIAEDLTFNSWPYREMARVREKEDEMQQRS